MRIKDIEIEIDGKARWEGRDHADGCVTWDTTPITATVEQGTVRFTFHANEQIQGMEISLSDLAELLPLAQYYGRS